MSVSTVSYFVSLIVLEKGMLVTEFDISFNILQEEATTRGLDDNVLIELANVIIHQNLS